MNACIELTGALAAGVLAALSLGKLVQGRVVLMKLQKYFLGRGAKTPPRPPSPKGAEKLKSSHEASICCTCVMRTMNGILDEHNIAPKGRSVWAGNMKLAIMVN